MQKEQVLHENILKYFATLLKKERLAHAYLFIGRDGLGKFETAIDLAKMINCENKLIGGFFCDECPSCIKINKNSHPDVHALEKEEGENIKIEKVRELIGQIQLRPFISTRKIFIIKNAEQLSLEGANALLKTLEEPSAHSLLILTTSSPERNLGTIRSRCQAVLFSPSSYQGLEGFLLSEGESKDKARFFAHFSQGAMGRAKELQGQDFYARKNEFIDGFILNIATDAFMKELLAEKDDVRSFLDVLFSWIRDCILLKSGVRDERLIHLDRLRDLERFQEKFSFAELSMVSDEILKTYKLLAENLNLKVPLLMIKEMIWAK